jgi:hypothetical protein
VTPPDHLRADLRAAMAGAGRGQSAADRLCEACVDSFEVDGAAISVILDGTTLGTFGSSGATSRRLGELQFTFGEGPCLDAVGGGDPVLVPDLDDAREHRWPAFAPAALDLNVHAVFALPVGLASGCLGALNLAGSLLAAQLAVLPVLDLMTADVDWPAEAEGEDGWSELASLERVEVYQATGMVMAQLDVGPAEALDRLRARGFATGQTASEIAWAVVERRLSLGSDHDGDHGHDRSPG